MKSKCTLVIGSSGFIGRKLTALLENRTDTFTISRSKDQYKNPSHHFSLDVSHQTAFEKVIAHLKSQYKKINIYFLAGETSVENSIIHPMDTYNQSMASFLSVINASKNTNCSIVFASSGAVYDSSIKSFFSELDSLAPPSPYAATKYASEGLAMSYSETFGMDIRIARIFSVYGEEMSRFFIFDLIKKLCSPRSFIKLSGSGLQQRDYLHVNDVSQGLIKIMENGNQSEVYNLCSGKPTALVDIIEKVKFFLDRNDVDIAWDQIDSPGIRDIWYGDNSKIKNIGFELNDDFNTQLKSTTQAIRSRLEEKSQVVDISTMQIPVSHPYISDEEASAAYEVIKNGWISMGEQVENFEKDFSNYLGIEHSIAVNSGTSALHLAVIASGIEQGDEVLIPDMTFFSTATAVLYEKAIPVLVKCDPRTYNISLEDAEKKLTNKTKAIISVDMNGLTVDYDELLTFADCHDIKIICDSAEALGGIYKGQKVGSNAPIHIFSFFPNKNITTGEGGMITLNNLGCEHYENIKQLRSMGQERRYHHVSLGYNYRMNDIGAALGREQLKKIETILKAKEKIVERYNLAFKENKFILQPYIPEYATRPSWFLYTISLDESIDRNYVVEELAKNGVETRASFPPLHTQPALKKILGKKINDHDLASTLLAWKRLINLPIWAGLNQNEQDYVIEKTISIVNSVGEK